MRWGAEFWMRIGIALFFFGLVLAAPMILFPFTVSLVLAILLNPLAKFIHEHIRVCRGMAKMPYDIAILISFAIFISIVYMIIVHIIVPFIGEFRAFVKGIPDMVTAVQQAIPEIERQYQLSLMPPEAKNFISRIIQDIGEYTLKVAQFSLSAIFSFASTVVELIVVPFITFYMMKRGSYFVHVFIGFFPERFHHHLETIFKEIHFMLNAYLRGQLLLSVIMAFVVFLGMWAMNIPYPLVIGLLAGVVEMIPLIKPSLERSRPFSSLCFRGQASWRKSSSSTSSSSSSTVISSCPSSWAASSMYIPSRSLPESSSADSFSASSA